MKNTNEKYIPRFDGINKDGCCYSHCCFSASNPSKAATTFRQPHQQQVIEFLFKDPRI